MTGLTGAELALTNTRASHQKRVTNPPRPADCRAICRQSKDATRLPAGLQMRLLPSADTETAERYQQRRYRHRSDATAARCRRVQSRPRRVAVTVGGVRCAAVTNDGAAHNGSHRRPVGEAAVSGSQQPSAAVSQPSAAVSGSTCC